MKTQATTSSASMMGGDDKKNKKVSGGLGPAEVHVATSKHIISVLRGVGCSSDFAI